MAPTIIEYLNEEQLRQLLFNRQEHRGDGLLQKFLEPPDARGESLIVFLFSLSSLLRQQYDPLSVVTEGVPHRAQDQSFEFE